MFFQLGTGSTLARAMREVGFVDVEERRIPTRLLYDSEEEALDAAFAGGPVAMAYSRFDGPTKAEAHAAYLETISGFRNGTGYDIPGEFVIVKGRKPPV